MHVQIHLVFGIEGGSLKSRIITGDATEVLAKLRPASVDCCITDPPYGETSFVWDKRRDWLRLVRPLLKPAGSVWFFASLRYLLSMDLTGWKLAQEIVWEKHNGSNFHNDRFRRVHEFIVQLYPDNRRWSEIYTRPVFTGDARRRRIHRKTHPPHLARTGSSIYETVQDGQRFARSVMRVSSCHGYAMHPTQKPVDIVRPLVEYSCPPGGLVLDPFSGAGTTGLVALQHGRRYLGIELNPSYVDMAQERLAA